MACARCLAARKAAGRAIKALAAGNISSAANETRAAAAEIKAKVAESDRIRAITRKR